MVSDELSQQNVNRDLRYRNLRCDFVTNPGEAGLTLGFACRNLPALQTASEEFA